MCAHRATAPAEAGPASDALVDPWLRMRLAPVRARRSVGGATVRNALRAIASVRPSPALLASALRPVRALLDRERGRLRQRLAHGAPVAEIARAEARLLDGTVIGLCHVGRLLEPRPLGMVPPLAVIARSDYGRRKPVSGASVDLLFLVASDPGRLEQGLAIAQFVARELASLGWQASTAKRTVQGCLAETHLDPAIAADLSAARLIWGHHGLFAELRAALAQAVPRDQDEQPAPRLPERSPALVLAA